MTVRLTARQRMGRLLSVIPWVTQNEGTPIDEIERRFDYPRDMLLRDLQEVVFFVGVYPFTPDQLIEVDISDDKVWIRYADWFARPLRLTPEEAATLLATANAALVLADEDTPDPLTRALTKLGTMIGAKADQAIDVRLGDAQSEIVDEIRCSLDAHVQMEIRYYSYGRDQISERNIEPLRLFNEHGNWYLDAWCNTVGAPRMFRVDRIRSARATDIPIADSRSVQTGSFSASSGDPRVTLRLEPSAQWVIEQYPHESIDHSPDGTVSVELAITEIPWLQRLMLRLGPAAIISRADPPISVETVSEAARRILSRYDT